MMNKELFLSQAILRVAERSLENNRYGIMLKNLPEFNYLDFLVTLNDKFKEYKIQVFCIGFNDSEIIDRHLDRVKESGIELYYTVEDAEDSRNYGDEGILRIIIVRREVVKLTSLLWFEAITEDSIYKEVRTLSYEQFGDLNITNVAISNLIRVLGRKEIRQFISLDRLTDYISSLYLYDKTQLQNAVINEMYRLGLCIDYHLFDNSSIEGIKKAIIKNNSIVYKIGALDIPDRNNIQKYAANSNSKYVRLILKYYELRDIQLLKNMELVEVEKCLKNAKEEIGNKNINKNNNGNGSNGSNGKRSGNDKPSKPDSTAVKLIIDRDQKKIKNILDQVKDKVDAKSEKEKDKAVKIEVNIDGEKIEFIDEPSITKLVDVFVGDDLYGGVLKAEVNNPKDALMEIHKYNYEDKFTDKTIERIRHLLGQFDEYLIDTHLKRIFDKFIEMRNILVNKVDRLKDCPALQVAYIDIESGAYDYYQFTQYIDNYASLLNYINASLLRMWGLDTNSAKEVVSAILSLDMVFIIGDKAKHAIPTPLNPLYLWKYVELARQIFEDSSALVDQDKEFIVRKSNEIPDPISTLLINSYITGSESLYIPAAGRIGNSPFYSSKQQVDQAEDGVEELKKNIIKYLKLYPHGKFCLKMTVINPPSVQVIIEVIKKLNSEKEISLEGLELFIYHTKEVNKGWAEIDDSAYNEGMLSKFKLGDNNRFRVSVFNKVVNYSKLLGVIDDNQHLIIFFDPNEKKVDIARNNPLLQIHPLCVPKVYEYQPISGKVEVRPTNEGGIFSDYTSLTERLNDRTPQYNQHTSLFYNAPLEEGTYKNMLEKTDWLMILDQNLKIWDVCLNASSEKLYYHNGGYRDVGVYSINKHKIILGFKQALQKLGNFTPTDEGVNNIIERVRRLNERGLLSLASYSSTEIFNSIHAKGATGMAIAGECYYREYPKNILVGLDTELARRWLDEREDGKLPDLIGINIDEKIAYIDIIEVKTHSGDFHIDSENKMISGRAVEQVNSLEGVIQEIFNERTQVTTTSRREILRTQVFETLFQSDMSAVEKQDINYKLNRLFSGKVKAIVRKLICYIDFDTIGGSGLYKFNNNDISLIKIDKALIDGVLDGTCDDILSKMDLESNRLFGYYTYDYVVDKSDKSSLDNEFQIKIDEIPGVRGEDIDSFNNKEEDISLDDEDSVIVEKVEVVSIDQVNLTENLSTDEESDYIKICELSKRLTKALRDFNINANEVNPQLVQRAARFIRFRVELNSGETLSKVIKYKEDISRELEAQGEILVGNERGTRYVKIDIPYNNNKPIKLLDNIEKLPQDPKIGELKIIAGQQPDGTFEILDIAKAPHILTAGATGSGKTIFLYSLIISLISQFGPESLEMILIDPKQTDFIFFNSLPHLRNGEVITDPEEALVALEKIVNEDIDIRTQMLKSNFSRDIISYNAKCKDSPMKPLVVVIDEYADLIQVAETLGKRKGFENSLMRMAQRVRNLGIHLVIATQRPSSNVVTSVLKANMPFRISFRLPAHQDSMTILDMPGAEDLLGKGDMLILNEGDVKRLQGLFVEESELVEFIQMYSK